MKENTIYSVLEKAVLRGLRAEAKYLPDWLTYDQSGREMKEELSLIPEYYPALAERQFTSLYAAAIAYNLRQDGRHWNVVDWSEYSAATDVISPFVRALISAGTRCEYFPVTHYFDEGAEQRNTQLFVHPAAHEVLEVLPFLQQNLPTVFFLGSTIETLDMNDLVVMLRALSLRMQRRDRVILYFDLVKSPSVIEKAYHDYKGVTTLLQKNALVRINRDLGGTFEPRQFEYWPIYDAPSGACRKYLVSTTEQLVRVKKANKEFMFKPWEAVFVGMVQKYTREMIEEVLLMSGLKAEKQLYDDKRGYTLQILRSI